MKTELELIIEYGEYRINYAITQLIKKPFILDIWGTPVGLKGWSYPRNYVERDQNDKHYGWVKTNYDDVYFCDMYKEPRPQTGVLNYEQWKELKYS